MKNKLFILLSILSIEIFAQDTIKISKPVRKFQHEIGVNASLLLRQVFGSSNSGLTLLPYNLTYKLIHKKTAIRLGLGLTLTNSTSSSYSNFQNGSYQPGPDPMSPNFSNTSNYYFRIGWEYRYKVGRKVLVYAGIDAVGEFLDTKYQNSNVSNYLPNSYQFTRTNSTSHTNGLGIGHVLGIQFYCTKRLSVFTEIPFYYMSSNQINKSNQYSNTLSSGNPIYTQTYTFTNQTNSTKSFSISIPATLYLAIKF